MIKILFVQKFLQFQEFDVISKKNFSIDFLSTYVLLIQNRKIGQKFLSFENFENSRNSTSFPRTAEILGKSYLFIRYVLLIQSRNFGRNFLIEFLILYQENMIIKEVAPEIFIKFNVTYLLYLPFIYLPFNLSYYQEQNIFSSFYLFLNMNFVVFIVIYLPVLHLFDNNTSSELLYCQCTE